MKPLLITSGEPAGIGPDLCLLMAHQNHNIVVAGDRNMLLHRAKLLNLDVTLEDYIPGNHVSSSSLRVWHMPLPSPATPGVLNDANAGAVISMLSQACEACLNRQFSGLVTAPVHKAHLQKVDATFTGHTEFFQMICGAPSVVMMLADDAFRVALVTTHLPLRAVPDALTIQKIKDVITTVYIGLQNDFALSSPRIAVAGLNPHAGENGCLGHEEIDIIVPALQQLKSKGWDIEGPLSADTLFMQTGFDAFIAMYHDQGLAVFKYATFGKAANITLGLPIIRTSVDHGTALNLAGTGKISVGSMNVAVNMAKKMVFSRGELL
jgi:4-hydroxythreonine-4-phosphate dehydrogenase